jgi:hypothetical protein
MNLKILKKAKIMGLMNNIIKFVYIFAAIVTILLAIPTIRKWFTELTSIEINQAQIIYVLIFMLVILLCAIIADFFIRKSKAKKKKANKIITYFKNYESEQGGPYLSGLDDKKEKLINFESSIKDIIKDEKTSILDSDIYYLYLFSMLNGANMRIWATSIMGAEEWNKSPEEKEFLRLNIKASERKVLVERIFIVEKDNIQNMLNTPAVIMQIEKRNDYLKTYIIIQEDLKEKKPELLTDVGSGFLAFDDYAVASDVFADCEIRGRLFLDEGNISWYNRLFTNLRDFAMPLDKEVVEEYKRNNSE